ncbi:acyl carrier protein [Nocardia nova]|nr:acyl carrier protein [Nocardia nova]
MMLIPNLNARVIRPSLSRSSTLLVKTAVRQTMSRSRRGTVHRRQCRPEHRGKRSKQCVINVIRCLPPPAALAYCHSLCSCSTGGDRDISSVRGISSVAGGNRGVRVDPVVWLAVRDTRAVGLGARCRDDAGPAVFGTGGEVAVMTSSTRPDIDELRELVSDVFDIDPDQVTATAHFKEDLGADSAKGLELAVHLVRRYNVEVSGEELLELGNVQGLYDHLLDRLS